MLVFMSWSEVFCISSHFTTCGDTIALTGISFFYFVLFLNISVGYTFIFNWTYFKQILLITIFSFYLLPFFVFNAWTMWCVTKSRDTSKVWKFSEIGKAYWRFKSTTQEHQAQGFACIWTFSWVFIFMLSPSSSTVCFETDEKCYWYLSCFF